MTRIYLPRYEITRRQILKRLRELNVYVPGAEQLDVSHLRDILQKEEELAQRPKAPRPERKLPKSEIVLGLQELLDWRRIKEGGGRLY